MVVVAAEREGRQARGAGDTLRGGRAQPTHGLSPESGEGVGIAHTGTLMALQTVRLRQSNGSAASGRDAGGGGPGAARRGSAGVRRRPHARTVATHNGR